MRRNNVRKGITAAAAAAMMATSLMGGITASAVDEWSYSDDLAVYVNGTRVDNDEYKPIIVNNRTLVRLVPVFEAMGYNHTEMDSNKVVEFIPLSTTKFGNSRFVFKAESTKAIVVGSDVAVSVDGNGELTGEGKSYELEVPATLQYFDTFYVPLRSFCEMVDMDIEWDDARRSVYVGAKPTIGALENKVYKQYSGDEVVGSCVVSHARADIAEVEVDHLRSSEIDDHVGTVYLQSDGTYTANGYLGGTNNKTGEEMYEPKKYVFTVVDESTLKMDSYDSESGEYEETITFVAD